MAAPLRQQILDAVVTRLKTITTVGGYNLQIGSKVYDWRQTDLAPAELPAIEVRDTVGTIDITTLDGGLAHRLNFTVIVLASGKSAPASVRLGLQDILAAVYTDRTFGGLCDSFVPESSEIDQQQAGDLVAAGQVTFSTTYYTGPGEI